MVALRDGKLTCRAKGFDVKYEWKRHSGSVTGGRQSSLTISRATPLDEDQYYCVAMTEGGYDFSNNVTLTVDGKNNITDHRPCVSSELRFLKCPDKMSEQIQNCSDIMEF